MILSKTVELTRNGFNENR